ncbi:MAG: phosphatidate cytidylyltransferase [Pseudohongiellaceae bacterium]
MLKQRLITGLILAPIVLCGVFLLEQVYFSLFFGFVIALAGWEWANLSSYTTQPQRLTYALALCGLLYLISFLSIEWVLLVSVIWWLIATLFVLTFPDTTGIWSAKPVRCLIGIVVLLPMWKTLVFIREADLIPAPELNGLWVILYMLLMVWFADVGAYFSGKAWGKAKLAPKVSPGKSWAGAWGGLISTVILAIATAYLLELPSILTLQLIVMTVITASISIIGDLTESMFKRHRGIKDSSQLLPGHGGILDRIDSLVAAVPVFVFLLLVLGWVA